MSLRYCSHLFNFLQMSHNSFSPNSFTQPREAIWCIGCVPVCAKSFPLFDSATPLTIALQGPLSSRFSRQEYWSGLPFPPSGIKLTSLMSPALAGRFFTTSATWEAHWVACLCSDPDLATCWLLWTWTDLITNESPDLHLEIGWRFLFVLVS